MMNVTGILFKAIDDTFIPQSIPDKITIQDDVNGWWFQMLSGSINFVSKNNLFMPQGLVMRHFLSQLSRRHVYFLLTDDLENTLNDKCRLVLSNNLEYRLDKAKYTHTNLDSPNYITELLDSPLYIDKTRSIDIIMQHESHILCILSMKGSGKTTFANTIEAFLDCKKPMDVFSDLKIMKTSSQHMKGSYATIKLSLKIDTFHGVVSNLYKQLYDAIPENLKIYLRKSKEELFSGSKGIEDFKTLLKGYVKLLHNTYAKETIIIIDDYDFNHNRLLELYLHNLEEKSSVVQSIKNFEMVIDCIKDIVKVKKIILIGSMNILIDTLTTDYHVGVVSVMMV
jgi:hypothetical protein